MQPQDKHRVETQMKKLKVEFSGSDGVQLIGLLEQPDTKPSAFVLFAHCFTCGKDIASASRVSRALVARGYAVLRFDFTGIGGSDGDFANTNFSSNVQDLLAAADYLRSNWQAPKLLIGHSLGGTAVLKAAELIAESTAVVTIGAPADASHVVKQFACDIDAIEKTGVAEVNLAGRPFTIKKQFLEDIAAQSMEHLGHLNKALLVLHSPTDTTVSINQAEQIYKAAKHPKSFISLDNADHLLSKQPDAEYVAQTIAAWAGRYVGADQSVTIESSSIKGGEVVVEERNTGLTCTSMTLRMYANRKKWPLQQAEVHLRHYRDHGADCAHCDDQRPQVDVIDRQISLTGELDNSQRQR